MEKADRAKDYDKKKQEKQKESESRKEIKEGENDLRQFVKESTEKKLIEFLRNKMGKLDEREKFVVEREIEKRIKRVLKEFDDRVNEKFRELFKEMEIEGSDELIKELRNKHYVDKPNLYIVFKISNEWLNEAEKKLEQNRYKGGQMTTFTYTFPDKHKKVIVEAIPKQPVWFRMKADEIINYFQYIQQYNARIKQLQQ